MRRRNRRLSLRKTLFILPNLFTLGSTFCAFNAMLLASQATRPWDFWAAAWMIGFAGILDGVDGRVARLTRTQSEFGMQLDSLADAIAFGVAPAWLFYHWGLNHLGGFGLFCAFAYAACAMIRLARFNVTHVADEEVDHRFFQGLPTPAAAGFPVLAAAIHSEYLGNVGVAASAQPMVAAMVLGFGFLMVSNIRFASFKGVRWSKRNLFVFVAIFGSVTYLSMVTTLDIGLAAGFAGYVAFHLAVSAVKLERRLFGRKAVEDDELLKLIDDVEDVEEDEEPLAPA